MWEIKGKNIIHTKPRQTERKSREDEPERRGKDKSEESHNKTLTQSIGRARHLDCLVFLLLFLCRASKASKGSRKRLRGERRRREIPWRKKKNPFMNLSSFCQLAHLIHFCTFRVSLMSIRVLYVVGYNKKPPEGDWEECPESGTTKKKSI